MSGSRSQRVVAVGGGHGCAQTMRALARLPVDVTAVVTVADDGGSSGRLRRDLDVVAFGDLRMVTLAAAEESLPTALAAHRFARGELAGHSLGNLMLLGLVERRSGDLVAALADLGALVGAPARVLPCTTDVVELHAQTDRGSVTGQAAVARTERVRRVTLAPADPTAPQEVLAAIADADLIVLGPGSLFTSIIPNLLVPAVGAAVARSHAPVVLVANLREQPGETAGMDLVDHLEALREHVPDLRLDVVVAHRPERTGATVPLGARAAPPLAVDPARLATLAPALATTLVVRDLAGATEGHDPARLAQALAEVLAGLPTLDVPCGDPSPAADGG
jgi:uncharacterized cofD-like protein